MQVEDPQVRADIEVLKQLAQKHEYQSSENQEQRLKELEDYFLRRLPQIIDCRV